MPYRVLCNGELQKSLEARTGVVLVHSHFTPLHKIRYGVKLESRSGKTLKGSMSKQRLDV
jgi:hypothetical protein